MEIIWEDDSERERLRRLNLLAHSIVNLRAKQIKILRQLADEIEKQEPKSSRELDIIKIMQIV